MRTPAFICAALASLPAAAIGQTFVVSTGDQFIVTQTPGGVASGVPIGSGPGIVPPRDQPLRTGTSQLRGRVVAADTGQPLRKAIVRITAPELRESRSTATTADGLYEFKDLPAGRYMVNAGKGSYVTLSYGQTRAFEPGRPIELSENQSLDRVDLRLPRGGIITGRVLDEFGEPAADAVVMPMRQQFVQGRRRLMPVGRSSMTNDIGEFRLFGLAPGQYYLSATLRGAPALFEVSDDRSGYAPTYYPGSSDVASAQRVSVATGQSVADLTISLVPARTARLSGTVLDAEGRRVVTGAVTALPRGSLMPMVPSVGQVRPDGTFSIAGVPPGDYVLRSMGPGAPGMWFTATVTVAGQDVTGIELVPERPVTASGRLIVDAGSGGQAPVPATLQLRFEPLQMEDMMAMASILPAAVKDDLSFEVKALSGRMVLRVTTPDQAWGLKSVRHRGADVTDGIDISQGDDLSGLEVEITNQRPDVSGLVTTAKGERAGNYTVVIFPQDRERWANAMRYIAVGRPDQEGRFRIRTLPPGDYQAVALEYVEPGQWMDPEFLDGVRHLARGFSLGEGETKTLDLRLSELR
jgi:hypothetical protein